MIKITKFLLQFVFSAFLLMTVLAAFSVLFDDLSPEYPSYKVIQGDIIRGDYISALSFYRTQESLGEDKNPDVLRYKPFMDMVELQFRYETFKNAGMTEELPALQHRMEELYQANEEIELQPHFDYLMESIKDE